MAATTVAAMTRGHHGTGWRGALGIGVLAATVVLGACSDDDSTDSGNGPETTTTTTAPSAVSSTTTPTPGPLDRYAAYNSVSYADDAHWLCRPDRADVCSGNLDTTTIAADGTLTVVPFEPATAPAIDCFYVYPTISRDPTPNSDWNASDAEEGYAAINQVARLRADCRVFAPVYRQRTLGALASNLGSGDSPGEVVDPFGDVLDAWKTYMATENRGRGVVLVGHSQGAALLNQLIQEEIDPNDDVRSLLVSAYLAGWAVAVPEGEDVGGDFANVPLCRSDDQSGCVVTWSSFRSSAPPVPGAFFGKPRTGDDPAACTNPAALAGGSAEPDSVFPANASASILASVAADAPGAGVWVDPALGKVTTPFVSVPGLVSTECASTDGFSYLKVTVQGDPADPRADDIGGDLTPEWGLHLIDFNLVMGNVVDLVATQATSWASAR